MSETPEELRRVGRYTKGEMGSPKLRESRILNYINGTANHPEEASGMADPKGALASAAEFTRGGVASVPDHDATESQRAARIKAEQQHLIAWAKANRKLGGKIPANDVGGGKHIVRLDQKADVVYKATNPEKQKGYGIALGSFTHGATPAEYLDRLSLQNEIFNDDIRLERVVVRGGKPIIVTSQPAVKGPPPKQEQIDELMAGKGFEQFTPGAYYDKEKGLLIFDLLPKNAGLGDDGVIYPFDPVIQRIDAEFADFLRHHPDRIHNR